MNNREFLDAAKAGIVTVKFQKINSDEVRVMPCTLNKELSKQDIEIHDINANSAHFAVWAMDKQAWRSFRVNTVIEWYKGEPKTEEGN